jgi:hypothetical protein
LRRIVSAIQVIGMTIAVSVGQGVHIGNLDKP